jgi:hypothetical protein
MAWWKRRASVPPEPVAITAAAVPFDTSRDSRAIIRRMPWQEEAWEFYATQGEYAYAIDWAANANSRMRLKAARVVPGSDEPEILDVGPAVDLMDALAGGVGGQSELLSQATKLLQIPGDSYAVGRQRGPVQDWSVYSPDIVKLAPGGGFEIQISESTFERLAPGTLVVRIYNKDPRKPWLATSPSRAVTGVLGEIDLYNRHIVTTLTSRLANNGILIMPQELSFAGTAQNAQAPSAIIPQLIEVASQAIRNPGSASAAIPIPLEVPGQWADTIRHLTLASPMDEHILEARDKALTRLARSLNVPAEILTGVGSVNHWGAWQIEDSAIKIHLSPVMETICAGLTEGYLIPGLRAMGVPVEETDGTSYVVWYDTSELEQKPDLAERAVQLHDRVAISDAALREAGGFDEQSAPTPEEAKRQILTRLAYNGQSVTDAMTELTGVPTTPVPESNGEPTPGDGSLPPEPDDSGTGITVPDTIADMPPTSIGV